MRDCIESPLNRLNCIYQHTSWIRKWEFLRITIKPFDRLIYILCTGDANSEATCLIKDSPMAAEWSHQSEEHWYVFKPLTCFPVEKRETNYSWVSFSLKMVIKSMVNELLWIDGWILCQAVHYLFGVGNSWYLLPLVEFLQ